MRQVFEEHIFCPLLFQVIEGTHGHQVKRCFLNKNLSDSIIKSFLNHWEIVSCFLRNQKLIASIPSSVGFKLSKLEISHEIIVLSKGIFVGTKKSQSSIIYVSKVGTIDFDKISAKLLNRCVGLS